MEVDRGVHCCLKERGDMEKVKLRVGKSSGWSFEEFVEFETLQDLLNYVAKLKYSLIIHFDKETKEYSLEIYDAYRE